MSVYVDPLQGCVPNPHWRWKEACHLFADSLDELHAFAAKLGLRRSWFQNHRKLPHYDLTPGVRRRAVALGAREVTHRERVAMTDPGFEARMKSYEAAKGGGA